MKDTFLSKNETKIDDIRKLSRENLISQLVNSNDYYASINCVHVVLWNERQIDLTIIGILDKCYDIYQC